MCRCVVYLGCVCGCVLRSLKAVSKPHRLVVPWQTNSSPCTPPGYWHRPAIGALCRWASKGRHELEEIFISLVNQSLPQQAELFEQARDWRVDQHTWQAADFNTSWQLAVGEREGRWGNHIFPMRYRRESEEGGGGGGEREGQTSKGKLGRDWKWT